ncbi:MAG TPA: FKBP-type peptidyl-prolyl cis-trans isomerase [Allosphingosinicella sp.]
MSVTAVPLRPIRKGSVLKLWIAIALLSLIAAGIAWAGTRGQSWERTASGLEYRVIKEGEGRIVTEADVAAVEYTGRLEDGTVFDSNVGKQPLIMPLAGGGMIPGFLEGVKLMNKGAKYRFRMPPELGYGEKGAGGTIPPGATLDFDVTLLEFIPAAELQGMMGPGGPGGAPGGVPGGPEGMPQGAPGGPPQGMPGE